VGGRDGLHTQHTYTYALLCSVKDLNRALESRKFHPRTSAGEATKKPVKQGTKEPALTSLSSKKRGCRARIQTPTMNPTEPQGVGSESDTGDDTQKRYAIKQMAGRIVDDEEVMWYLVKYDGSNAYYWSEADRIPLRLVKAFCKIFPMDANVNVVFKSIIERKNCPKKILKIVNNCKNVLKCEDVNFSDSETETDDVEKEGEEERKSSDAAENEFEEEQQQKQQPQKNNTKEQKNKSTEEQKNITAGAEEAFLKSSRAAEDDGFSSSSSSSSSSSPSS
jgi:hypothetical protein